MTKRMMKKIPGFPIYHAGKKMHWTTGHAVWNMGGIVFLSGAEGRDPDTDIARPGIKAQAKLALERIKARLEEFGTSLDNILHLTYYVVGPEFPNGVQEDQKWKDVTEVLDTFGKKMGFLSSVRKIMRRHPPYLEYRAWLRKGCSSRYRL